MTVTTAPRTADYRGDGATVTFPVPFRFLAAAHLRVVLIDAEGTETAGAVASVAGVGAASGGTVTLSAAPAAGVRVVIYSQTPLSQEVDFTPGGAMPGDVVERAFDKLAMGQQEQAEQLSRAVVIPRAAGVKDVAFPAPVPNKGLTFDSAGKLVTTRGDFDQLVGRAASSATNAAKSASTATRSEQAAGASEGLARDWAVKMSGAVAGGESSAKHHAQAAKVRARAASASETRAATSATAAKASATRAAQSEKAAAGSATKAKASATATGASATKAKTSATRAAGRATQAASSASRAAQSAQAAATQTTTARLSARVAAKSATDAARSLAAARISETNASTSRATAKQAEEDALGYVQSSKRIQIKATAAARTATTQATAAAQSASAAAGSATAAGASATKAGASETKARASQTAAKTSETAAAASATDAAASATQAGNAAATATGAAARATGRIATRAQAEGGTDNNHLMTPERTAQAIAKQGWRPSATDHIETVAKGTTSIGLLSVADIKSLDFLTLSLQNDVTLRGLTRGYEGQRLIIRNRFHAGDARGPAKRYKLTIGDIYGGGRAHNFNLNATDQVVGAHNWPTRLLVLEGGESATFIFVGQWVYIGRSMSPETHVGTLLPYGGKVPPAGYLLCDGSWFYDIHYPELALVIGRTYGQYGVHPRVPDFRGQKIAGRAVNYIIKY